MSKVSFNKNKAHKAFKVSRGANLMQALLDNGIPVASSCKGQGVCGKCHIKILKGAANLSAETPSELQLKEKNCISETSRISCQTKILGNIVIDADYW